MSALKAKQMDVVMGIVSERDVFTNSNYEIWEKSVLWSPALHEALFIFSITSSRYRVGTAKIQWRFSIIGASLSEPLLDELAGAFLWYIYIYIYIYICIHGQSFGPAWAPRKRATRKRKAGLVKVRGHTMSAKWGRKSVILFYASVRGLLTLKRQKYGLYTDGESYHRTVA